MIILFPLWKKNYIFSHHVGGHIDPQRVHVAIQASDCHVANLAKTENSKKEATGLDCGGFPELEALIRFGFFRVQIPVLLGYSFMH
jgi:hypothetical protein